MSGVLYKGHLEIIWTRLICSHFIIFTPKTKQLLAQHIALIRSLYHGPLFGSFHIASGNHSLGVLECHVQTATCSASVVADHDYARPEIDHKCLFLAVSVAVSGLVAPICTHLCHFQIPVMSWRVPRPRPVQAAGHQRLSVCLPWPNRIQFSLWLSVQFPCQFWSSIPNWTQCCVHLFSLHKFQVTDNEYLTVKRHLSTGTTWFISAPENCLPFFTTVVPAL